MTDEELEDARYLQSFIFWCPQCGTRSDDPDKHFALNGHAPAPNSDYILFECFCHSCKVSFDVARLADRRVIECMTRGDYGPINEALLRRYLDAIDRAGATEGVMVGKSADGRAGELKGVLECDLDFLNEETNPGFQIRAPIVPMQVLALARGTRIAAVQSPDHIVMCNIDLFRLVLSLDQLEWCGTHGLHLSASNMLTKSPLSDLQFSFLIWLVFESKELGDAVEVAPAALQHVRHYEVPLPSLPIGQYKSPLGWLGNWLRGTKAARAH